MRLNPIILIVHLQNWSARANSRPISESTGLALLDHRLVAAISHILILELRISILPHPIDSPACFLMEKEDTI